MTRRCLSWKTSVLLDVNYEECAIIYYSLSTRTLRLATSFAGVTEDRLSDGQIEVMNLNPLAQLTDLTLLVY